MKNIYSNEELIKFIDSIDYRFFFSNIFISNIF